MLARGSAGAPDRLQRREAAWRVQLRHAIPDVPFGIASLTDRVLPHLFPTLDPNVFESVLAATRSASSARRRQAPTTLATDYSTSGEHRAANNYYGADVQKRVLVFFSDGESKYFDDIVLRREVRQGNVHVLFVHLWERRREDLPQKNNVDPGYRPDPQANQERSGSAAARRRRVLGEGSRDDAAHETKAFLGTGPQTRRCGEQRTQISLGPYVALMALLPLRFRVSSAGTSKGWGSGTFGVRPARRRERHLNPWRFLAASITMV
jgi:hypothetical protein